MSARGKFAIFKKPHLKNFSRIFKKTWKYWNFLHFFLRFLLNSLPLSVESAKLQITFLIIDVSYSLSRVTYFHKQIILPPWFGGEMWYFGQYVWMVYVVCSILLPIAIATLSVVENWKINFITTSYYNESDILVILGIRRLLLLT